MTSLTELLKKACTFTTELRNVTILIEEFTSLATLLKKNDRKADFPYHTVEKFLYVYNKIKQ